MLKKLLILMTTLLIFATGCASAKQVDDEFFSDLFQTWQDRSDQMVKLKDEKNVPKAFKEISQLEFDHMKAYQDKTFKDKKLGEEVHGYLNALEGMIKSLDKKELTYDDMNEYLKHYKSRVKHLDALSQDERYVLPEGATDDLALDEKQLAMDQKKLEERQQILKKFEEDLNKIEFTVVEQASNANNGQYTIAGDLKNTTGATLENFALTLTFQDAEEKKLDEDTAKIDKIAPDEEKTLTFKTSKVFESVASKIDIDELKINGE